MGENIDINDRLLVVAQRTLGLVDKQGGIGSSMKSNRFDTPIERGLVELMVCNIREGFVTKPEYLRHPPHLPDTEKELRLLLASTAERDANLRADLIEWVNINRGIASQSFTTWRNLIKAIGFAESLLASTEADDELNAWSKEIQVHLYNMLKVGMVELPADVDAFLAAKLDELSPVPEWLRTGKASVGSSVFVPKRSTRGKASTSRIAQGNYDDDE